MSTNYYAQVVYGYPFERGDLVKKTPNPLWGKAKFDPETGDRVEQFIEEDFDLYEIVKSRKAKNLEKFITTDSRETVVGVALTESIDIGRDDLVEVGNEPLMVQTKGGNMTVEAHIRDICQELGIEFDPKKLRTYLVGHCSY